MSASDKPLSLFRDVAAAQAAPGQPEATFNALNVALQTLVGHKVMTLLKIDAASLTSRRLYSSLPQYPIGRVKQHHHGAWSEAVVDRGTYFMATTLDAVRRSFPDHAGIEAAGCGAIICLPVRHDGRLLGTLNLWHVDGHYDAAAAERALPFTSFLVPACL